ncbi:lactosylceramide 4-alpha-galactosyltransferase-like [Dermacentor andersoni]|uniref:lactosylceramide 4-alpha-galactosyltransferase-like n=1 Tax=Dermacentor andersoni TaxID=34620 RepID=UPI00241609B1|nr:lactosylceramide 4-alpha-galactosyltransferase-like [Dermacentor andersoni]
MSRHLRAIDAWNASAPRERSGFSRIFFLETGGHGLITARIACAVESAARLHPNWTVYLLSVAYGEEASKGNATFAGPFAQMLRTIPNVVMSAMRRLKKNANIRVLPYFLPLHCREQPNEVFQGTPLESWYESGILSKSAYPVEHLADALRLAVLYKQGGVYLDIDVIVMRSLHSLPPCVFQAPVNNGDMVANSFLAFHRGDPFLQYLMQLARQVYQPRAWSSIGPLLLRQATLARCGAQRVTALLGRQCGGNAGFTVMPHWMFLAVPADHWQVFFTAKASRQAWLMSDRSYVMHVYNKFSAKVHAVPGCAYRQAAEVFCHGSLQLSLDINGIF